MKSLVWILALGSLVGCSTSKRAGPPPVPSVSSETLAPPSQSVEAATSALDADVSSTRRKPTARQGTATLVIQRVDSQCMVEPGETHTAFLGYDVLVEVVLEGQKPAKTHAFCPTLAADGGLMKPTLDTWQMCRSFRKCRVVSLAEDARESKRVEVECGKERLTLESDDEHTVVRGSFGEREVAPFPMRLGPAKTVKRIANVDC